MLIRHKININVINLIEHWFIIGAANVKWGDIFSKIVKLKSGVRQGGIISPILFTAYIDSILTDLEQSNLGCYIGRKCMNSFLYTDDLILFVVIDNGTERPYRPLCESFI